MSDSMIARVFSQIDWTHKMILKLTTDLTAQQFNGPPGPQAPPIGWHLWHVARLADMLQARFPGSGDGARAQIWDVEELALRWELDPATLGPIQGGEGMDHAAAAALPQQIGQAAILDYATRSFAFYKDLPGNLTPQELDSWQLNPNSCKITDDGRIIAAPPQESQLGSGLAGHLGHISRHLGMIEALRGAQGFHGTATA